MVRDSYVCPRARAVSTARALARRQGRSAGEICQQTPLRANRRGSVFPFDCWENVSAASRLCM